MALCELRDGPRLTSRRNHQTPQGPAPRVCSKRRRAPLQLSIVVPQDEVTDDSLAHGIKRAGAAGGACGSGSCGAARAAQQQAARQALHALQQRLASWGDSDEDDELARPAKRAAPGGRAGSGGAP